jgi:hypothetical protein
VPWNFHKFYETVLVTSVELLVDAPKIVFYSSVFFSSKFRGHRHMPLRRRPCCNWIGIYRVCAATSVGRSFDCICERGTAFRNQTIAQKTIAQLKNRMSALHLSVVLTIHFSSFVRLFISKYQRWTKSKKQIILSVIYKVRNGSNNDFSSFLRNRNTIIMKFTYNMGTYFIKFRLFLPQSLLHYQHTFPTSASDAAYG